MGLLILTKAIQIIILARASLVLGIELLVLGSGHVRHPREPMWRVPIEHHHRIEAGLVMAELRAGWAAWALHVLSVVGEGGLAFELLMHAPVVAWIHLSCFVLRRA